MLEATAKKLYLRPHHTSDEGRKSVTVTAYQLTRIERDGIPYEVVPGRTMQTRFLCLVFRSFCGSTPKPVTSTQGPVTKPSNPSQVYRTPTVTKRRNGAPVQVTQGVKVMYGWEHIRETDVTGGQGVTVAVVDSGHVGHVDFLKRDGKSIIAQCKNYLSGLATSCTDSNGHGTNMIGYVAAAGGRDGQGLLGMAPQTSILSSRVIDRAGMAYADEVPKAINDAAEAGAEIILMAFGGPEPFALEREAIQYAARKGALLIGAAGNGPTQLYPGKYQDVLSVGAAHLFTFTQAGGTDADCLGPPTTC